MLVSALTLPLSWQSYGQEKSSSQALSAEFLLYLAEMQEVNDEWVDPISLNNIKNSEAHDSNLNAQVKNALNSEVPQNEEKK